MILALGNLALPSSMPVVAASSGWAVQGCIRWTPSERLQLDLLADAFDASSWDSRLYTLTPMLRGEYGATLLYGKGAVLGGRVRYRLSSHWQIEGRVQYEHQQRDVRRRRHSFASPALSWMVKVRCRYAPLRRFDLANRAIISTFARQKYIVLSRVR